MCPMKGVEGSRASYLQVQVDHAALVQQVNSLKHLSDQTGDLTFGPAAPLTHSGQISHHPPHWHTNTFTVILRTELNNPSMNWAYN